MRVVAIILLVCLTACALKPAPITLLDVREALVSLPVSKRAIKAEEISCQIQERKAQLLAKKKDLMPTWWIIMFAPIAVGGPWYLAQIPARKATVKEIILMNDKDQIVKEIMLTTPASSK
jgi:hypothetical protein